MTIKAWMTKAGPITVALVLALCAAALAKDSKIGLQNDCGYYMCRYEKENIDAIILEHARHNRTVMFGEIHDNVVAGKPPPLEDSLYVMSLLKRLKALGYGYLALEVREDAPRDTHSNDIVRCLADLRQGHTIQTRNYPFAKPGWIELMVTAVGIGFEPVFYHTADTGSDRDAAMFRSIKEQIFDRHAHAKALVYVGADHISKLSDPWDAPHRFWYHQPLGLLLNNFTRGKNYSVYLGYPDDTPAGCDLIIGRFIWSTHRKALHQMFAQPPQ